MAFSSYGVYFSKSSTMDKIIIHPKDIVDSNSFPQLFDKNIHSFLFW